jgi:hypothetical protein
MGRVVTSQEEMAPVGNLSTGKRYDAPNHSNLAFSSMILTWTLLQFADENFKLKHTG